MSYIKKIARICFIVNEDKEKFNAELSDNILTMQDENYDVEIQYSCCGNSPSALVIGRK